MSYQQQQVPNVRRPSRASKYYQQYLSFLKKWKTYSHNRQYQDCEQLCLDHIDRIHRSIQFQQQQFFKRHGRKLDYNDQRFYDIKNYRSKVRNLYAVLLHDYLKQHNAALQQYELCVQDDPYNASAHYNWAILYKNYYKDYSKAEYHYKRAIELKPKHAAYHNNYGLLLEQQLKKYNEARKQFAIALELDDTNGRAHTNMANLLKKHYGDYKNASYHYQKTINLDPQNPTRHFNYALFLKHNLQDYVGAASEFEIALGLDQNYYQAHAEYKNFLLTESPFHRKNDNTKTKSPHHQNNNNNNNNEPGNNDINLTDLNEHAYRCIRYSISLLWQKKPKDARDILQMAFRCQPSNALAKLLFNSFTTESLDFGNNNNNTNTEDIINELNDSNELLNKKDNILKQLQKQLQNTNNQLNIFLKNQINNNNIESLINDINSNLKLIQSALKPNHIYNNSSNEYEGKNTKFGKAKSYAHMNVPNSYLSNGSRSQKSKRHSIVSISSANDYPPSKFMEMHKSTLLNATQMIDNISNNMTTNNKVSKSSIFESLTDVKKMIIGTVRALDFVEQGNGLKGNVHSRGLTAKMIEEHNDIPSALNENNYEEENHEYTKTLGGMSMVSQTSSAVMDQRRKFLVNASRNPNVRIADKAVAQHIADTFLKVADDTPRSILTQSQLFFNNGNDSDDDLDSQPQESSNNENNGLKPNPNGNPNKKTKLNGATSKEQRLVDRVKRWMQNPTILKEMNNIFSWDFDVFTVCSLAGEHSMSAIFYTIAQKRDLIKKLNLTITSFCNFFLKISSEYKNNPYHNYVHGCDVLVNSNYFMLSKMFEGISDFDRLACLTAAACHDVGHPGNNNPFEIQTESAIAITYNDFSVLENYHASLAWRCMKKSGCNLIESLDKPQRQHFRKLFIAAILATDMAKHAEQQSLLANLIDAVTNVGVGLQDDLNENENEDEKEKQPDNDHARDVSISNIPPNHVYADKTKLAFVLIPLCVHTADLSNPSKPFSLYRLWADRVMAEFWNQGDKEKEKGLPVTPMLNREITDLPTCQTGFINHVIKPWFSLWAKLLYDKDQGPIFLINVSSNLQTMQELLAKNKEKEEQDKPKEVVIQKNNDNIVKDNNVINNNNGNNLTVNNDDESFSDESDEDNTQYINYDNNKNNSDKKKKQLRKAYSVNLDKKGKNYLTTNGLSKTRALSTLIGNVNVDEEIAPEVRQITGNNFDALALSRFKQNSNSGDDKHHDSLSIVGMKIEDITKISMLNRLQRIQELRSRTKQQEMMEYQSNNDDDDDIDINKKLKQRQNNNNIINHNNKQINSDDDHIPPPSIPFPPPNSNNVQTTDNEDDDMKEYDDQLIFNNNKNNPNKQQQRKKKITKTFTSNGNKKIHIANNKLRKHKSRTMQKIPEESDKSLKTKI